VAAVLLACTSAALFGALAVAVRFGLRSVDDPELGAFVTVAVALVLTQVWFPYRYWDLALHFSAFPSWVVLARDLVLVALYAVLIWPDRGERVTATAEPVAA